MRILVLDDQIGLAQTIVMGLEAYDYLARGFSESQEVLDLIQPDDLLLVDYHMPGMNGLEVAQKAYDHGWRGALVLMSGYPESIRESIDRPFMHRFLAKPFQLQALLDAVRDAARGNTRSV